MWQTFEHMPMIMGGFHGPDHVFDATNAAYREWMGRASVIGLPAPEVFPELVGQELFTAFDRVTQTGELSFQREWRFHADLTDTGEMQEFFMDVMVGPRYGSDGAPSGLTLWAVNVTDRVLERRAAQRETAEAEQRYQAALDVVVGLQQALLPADVPVLPGVDVAARYLVASRDQAAGGDWFDAVPLPDGSVALVVGDIVGHGMQASSAMGQLRSVLATALLETGDLELSLGWADRMATRSSVMRAATVCAAVLDPDSGTLRYATCGHPAPLVIASDGATRYLPTSGARPLGTSSSMPIIEEVLQPGEVLLLYTDGLIEQPGRGMDEGMATLARVAGNAIDPNVMTLQAGASTVERVCRLSVELLTRTGYDDDVTALAVQRRPNPVPVLSQEMPATPQALLKIRAELRGWLTTLEAPEREQHGIELAVSELVANAVEHAYPPGRPGAVRVHAELGADGALRVEVGDDGTWREPDGPKNVSGRGLWMAGAAINELHVQHPDTVRDDSAIVRREEQRHDQNNEHGRDSQDSRDSQDDNGSAVSVTDSTGTVVVVRHRLHRPATLASDPAAVPTALASGRPNMEFEVTLEQGPPRVLRVSGPLNITTAAAFADRLEVATRGGMHPVIIDLSDVDVLASAGVRVLFQAQDQHATHGHALDLVTAPGSLAAQVLDLVGLNHRNGQPDR